MTRARGVRYTPRSQRHVRVIQEWWTQHRPAAPDLFVAELTAAVERLAVEPALGVVYARLGGEIVRRVLLRKTRHHVYYLDQDGVVWVLAVWHASRGQGPPLR